MNRYHLRNWSNKEEVIIIALSWEIESYQHTFYQDVEGKIKTQSYTTRYYIVESVEYDIKKE